MRLPNITSNQRAVSSVDEQISEHSVGTPNGHASGFTNQPAMSSAKKDQRLQLLKNQEANAKIHKLIVKIISWKTGLVDGADVKLSDKISDAEWQKYRKHLLTISKTDSQVKVKEKLKEIYNTIKTRGGFG